ncbi:hypothetical protein U1Q18_004869 [Sarracenia purpurea var. burkii]
MLQSVLFGNNYVSVTPITRITISGSSSCRLAHFQTLAFLKKPLPSLPEDIDKSSVVRDSLRLLEWDKLCDSVASFAGTSAGEEATKAQLWSLNQTYEESMKLLDETNAAIEMHKYGGSFMDFSVIDVVLVKSAIQHVQRGFPVSGDEAMAIVALLQFAENLQFNLKSAIKEDAEWYQRFMPLAKMIMELVISRSLVKFIQQLLDEDGSVKDSASSSLKKSRDQVRFLEIKTTPEILYPCSGSGGGSIVEPLSAIPLNDELQQAKALVAKAEADVLLKITEKMQVDIGSIENLFNNMIQLDVVGIHQQVYILKVNARATYSLSFGGTCPDLFLPEAKDGGLALDALLGNQNSTPSYLTERKWTLYIPKAYHPLLIQQHQQNLQKAKKDVSNATSEIRRIKLQGENMNQKEETNINLSLLEMKVTDLEQARPIPVDIFVAQKTRVLVITGPNTGGKTIWLKTVGLAAVMAKSGLYVLSSEPVKIPWFDSVLADIGDEQSLSQSLSTFSGHLKQINVGAGTNPLEGAALGMSLLESFAESGPLLTMATTHHGELKTLKYRLSRDLHENLLVTRRKITDHRTDQRYWKMREISEMAAMARSTLHKKLRQIRASAATQPSQPSAANNSQHKSIISSQHSVAANSEFSVATNKTANSSDNARKSPQGNVLEGLSLREKSD